MTWRICAPIAALASTLLCGPTVLAQDRDPDWLKRPSPDDLVAVWPREAWERGEGGRAVISCTVTVQGALTDCSVVSEQPEGAGFGGAAIALTPQFIMKPRLEGGKAVASTIRMPVEFKYIDGPGPYVPIGQHLRASKLQQRTLGGATRRVYADLPWAQAPGYAEVVAAYPAKARAARVVARAALDCGIGRDARLTGCKVMSEHPERMEVGRAAMTLARHFLAPAADPGGQSLSGSRVHLAVTFSPEMLDRANPVIGKPNWTAMPTGGDMAAGFPAKARAAGVATGRIRLRCRIGVEGRLEDCAVQSEDPAGMGFGDAAKALTSNFRMSLWTAEGLPTQGGFVVVPLRYELPKAPPATAGKP